MKNHHMPEYFLLYAMMHPKQQPNKTNTTAWTIQHFAEASASEEANIKSCDRKMLDALLEVAANCLGTQTTRNL